MNPLSLKLLLESGPRVIFLGAIFFLSSSLHAEPVEKISVNDLAVQLRKSVRTLSYLEYKVTASRNEGGQPFLELRWGELGEKYRYEFRELGGDGSVPFQFVYSFDGERSARSAFGNGRFDVRTGRWNDLPDWIRNMEFVTGALEPLLRTDQLTTWAGPDTKLLSSDEIWKKFLSDATILGRESFGGRDCVAIKLERRFSRHQMDAPTYYIMYFDAKDLCPMGWRQYSQKSGFPVSEFVVKEFYDDDIVRSAGFRFPKLVQMSFYGGNFATPSNQLISKWSFKFDEISTDSTNADFSFDPSVARLIYDEDSEVFIQVPK